MKAAHRNVANRVDARRFRHACEPKNLRSQRAVAIVYTQDFAIVALLLFAAAARRRLVAECAAAADCRRIAAAAGTAAAAATAAATAATAAAAAAATANSAGMRTRRRRDCKLRVYRRRSQRCARAPFRTSAVCWPWMLSSCSIGSSVRGIVTATINSSIGNKARM